MLQRMLFSDEPLGSATRVNHVDVAGAQEALGRIVPDTVAVACADCRANPISSASMAHFRIEFVKAMIVSKRVAEATVSCVCF